MCVLLLAVGYTVPVVFLLKYELTHIFCHCRVAKDHVLHRHHVLHHMHPNCNYSFSAIWPDLVFGTCRA